MTIALALDVALALLVLCVAVWTIAAGPTFAAVVDFVAFGLLLALVWVRLAAVDVALTEAAIGSGVTGAVLIAAAARLRPTEPRSVAERPGVTTCLVAALRAPLPARLPSTGPRRATIRRPRPEPARPFPAWCRTPGRRSERR